MIVDQGAAIEEMRVATIEPIICRTFYQRLDPTRTQREMAIARAEVPRKTIGAGG